MQSSASPNKRSSFRSRTKGKEQKEGGNTEAAQLNEQKNLKSVLSFKMYMKQFPLGISDDVVKIVQLFEPVHVDFLGNLNNLRLYKSNLASLFENSWAKFMEVLRTIIVKMNRRNQKLVEDKEQKIVQVLNINSEKQSEIKRLKEKIDNIEHLRQLQNAELAVANNEIKMMNKEMSDIYSILQNDMGKILRYLTNVEESRERQARQGTQKFFHSLDNFSNVLNSMEAQQKNTGGTLDSMRQMIKQMARSTKVTTGTQVDESQLETQAANIFSSEENLDAPYEALEGTALNTAALGKFDHVLDKLKVKQKDYGHQPFHQKKSIQKPWALTPTLLIFLQNMSKQNETGRVLPWQYMKTLIHEIYTERIKSENEVVSGLIGNTMLFDEFVVFYFLKKYRIRRLTQVKLLEFIISLKYYSKFWIKAEIFCCMMDVMKYIPSHDTGDTYNYRMDHYTQNFFLQVYKRIANFDLIHEDDGTVYVPTKKVRKLMKLMLFFAEDMSLSRLYTKLEKDIRIFDKVEHADFDYATFLFLEEYFSVRRKHLNLINRLYSKIYERNQGFVSIDEIMSLFNQFSKTYHAGQMFPQKYPVESPLQLSKLYLYAITSGKNDYEINNPNFLQACQRYGFDSPFPFMHKCTKPKDKSKDADLSKSIASQKMSRVSEEPLQANQAKKEGSQAQNQIIKEMLPNDEMSKIDDGLKIKERNINQERVDVASKLFSQHFSIIKQLDEMTSIFADTLNRTQQKTESEKLLWDEFNKIRIVCQNACRFLKYPLLDRQ